MSFSNYKKFENVGIRSSNDTLIVMDSSNNNISLHSSDGGDDNVDTLSIKNIINKTPNMDLNLSSLNGNVINPVITINNNNGDCRIMTNLNVNGNINLTNGGMIKTTGQGSLGSIHCGVGTFTSIDSGSGMVKTTGIGSFGSIHCGVGTFTSIDSTGLIKTTGIGSFGSIHCGVGTFTSINSGSITSSNTLNAIVRRDSAGNFSAGTITADLTGTADKATKLANAITIGGVSFDGSANISLPGVNTSGNQNTSGGADKVQITASNSDVIYYPTFSNNYSGHYNLYAGSGIKYNPHTNILTAGTFNGTTYANKISGSISANSAGYASNLTVSDSGGSGNTHYVLFASGYTGGNYSIKGYSSLYYTPSNNYLYCVAWKALHSSAGVALVDVSSEQNLSNKTFTDSLITNGNLYLGSSNSSSNNGKKIYFHYHDSSIGGSYLYNSGTNYLIYQSGSHWGAANFGIKTNSASGAWAYLRFYTWNGSDYIRAYQGSVQHSGSWSSASDDRLKTDEKKITSEKGKEIIMKLRPQTYYKHQELNSTYDGPKLDSCKIYEAGFIAQEIYFEIPELRFLLSGLSKDHKEMSEIDINNIDFSNIQEDPNYSIFGNDILGVSYEQIVPYLTAHNQEQQKEIDTLKTESQQQQIKINTLETKVNTLETENAELKSIIDKLKTANSFEDFKNSL